MRKLSALWAWLVGLPTNAILVFQMIWIVLCGVAFMFAAGKIQFQSHMSFALAFIIYVYVMFLPLIFERFRPQR